MESPAKYNTWIKCAELPGKIDEAAACVLI